MDKTCVTCGDPLDPERAELKDYCLKRACVDKNYRPLRMVQIGQRKSSAEIAILTPEVERRLANGEYRRDPIVVSRQATTAHHVPPAVFKQPKRKPVNKARVNFVRALLAQGLRPDEIVQRGAYMKLTRAEVISYAGRR